MKNAMKQSDFKVGNPKRLITSSIIMAYTAYTKTREQTLVDQAL